MKIVVFLIALVVLHECEASTIIAKSDLTVCDSFHKNPTNIVENKACQKKIIVTQSVLSGQKETETLYFITNKVYDGDKKEQARLYNPFIIQITKTPAYLVYPFYYEATVNNKPYESVKTAEDCVDGWESKTTCGFVLDHNGEKIWDSQGFCCKCSYYEYSPRWTRTILHGGKANKWYRGGQDGMCGYKHLYKDDDRFSHCMLMDPLWYDVFSIGLSRLTFVINVKAFDQSSEVIKNETVTKWVDGGQLELGYHKRSAVGKYGRLIATFHGTFAATQEFYTLKDHYYLLIPKRTASNARHKQVKNGFRDYLIVPAGLVSLRDTIESCDMVGVSYSSFRRQGGGTFLGSGCYSLPGTCLQNQPRDLFDAGMRARARNKRPEYFPQRYGECVGINRKGPSEFLGIVYKIEDTITSLVTLEVSADDMILIYNRADGVIVKVFASDFTTMTLDGKMTVAVQNTGLVTADFHVVFASCSKGVYLNDERTASINPKAIEVFKYDLKVYDMKGKRHYCEIELYNSRRELLDQRNVTFRTRSPCICLEDCKCQCNKAADDDHDDDDDDEDDDQKDCNDDDDDDYNDDYDDYGTEKEDEGYKDGFIKRIWKIILSSLDMHYIVAIILLILGIFKAILGKQSLFIAKLGLGGLRRGQKITRKVNGKEMELIYTDDMHLIDPETDKVMVPNNADWDFYMNIFFFLFLPIIIFYNIGKLFSFLIKKLKVKTALVEQPVSQSQSPQTVATTSDNKQPTSRKIKLKSTGKTQRKKLG